ncbi:hypothetical protein PTTG_00361 [Puccinia triticina 1-1 BBBD Race 1]|uniref:Mago-bind domain-containing protein n=1 Tax=Puccinia triticina (isolate 1-1 / race 1 (BBBD)) TaxID=630390 RepID=A0A180GZR8_PUCT1|nr:hypothetical protein PTTG_00361 [Puccinia triticina 1-1 BBBD Race 1]
MPSRPPLLSELTPSTSGIVLDPNTGDRKVAPSKRPDGTIRKEIKIRPGFTPQEDVSKFRSARQAESESRKLPKGSVVGMIRPEVAVAQSALKGMTQAQKKNAKRKEKRKTENSSKLDQETEETPDQWDRSSTASNPAHDQPSTSPPPVAEGQRQEPPAPASSAASRQSQPAKTAKNPGKALFQSALKSSSSNPLPPPLQHLVPPQSSSATATSTTTAPAGPSPASTAKKDRQGNQAFKLFTNAVQSLEIDDKPKSNNNQS